NHSGTDGYLRVSTTPAIVRLKSRQYLFHQKRGIYCAQTPPADFPFYDRYLFCAAPYQDQQRITRYLSQLSLHNLCTVSAFSWTVEFAEIQSLPGTQDQMSVMDNQLYAGGKQ